MNWKKLLKILWCGFLYYSTIIVLFRRNYLKNGGAILAYHQISGALLEKHIQYLKKHYNLISYDKFINHLLQNNLPPHSVCLTFDDGYRTVFTENLPVLRKNNISAIVFLVVDILNRIPCAWWEDLRLAIFSTEQKNIVLNQQKYSIKNQKQKQRAYQKIIKYLKSLSQQQKMSEVSVLLNKLMFVPGESASIFMNIKEATQFIENGMEVGSHTISHPILSEIDATDRVSEINNSREQLEAMLNYPVKHFSYPNGTARDFNTEIAELVKQAGYQSAVTLIAGKNGSGTDLCKLCRIEVGDENGVSVLATKLAGLFW
jgi:peptidoglycan/xylan/chitin deacetylase (PgdA/CDA1 family)